MRPERAPRVNINARIRAPRIRVIDEDGGQLGVMTPAEGMRLAQEKGLDLVEVAPAVDPPVCRIIDFGRWQYEQKKKANEAKKKQTMIQVKEIKFRPGTDDHDYDFKKNHAARILIDGDKVKATVHFRGREVTHKELGLALLMRLVEELAEEGSMEVEPKMEGMNMFTIIGPKKGRAPNKPKPKPAAPKPAATAPPSTAPEAVAPASEATASVVTESSAPPDPTPDPAPEPAPEPPATEPEA
jgi:translation initiation factor IF-3